MVNKVELPPVIVGEGIFLSPPQQTDIKEIVTTCADAESAKWTHVPAPYAEKDAHWWLETHNRELIVQGGQVWAIRTSENGLYLGSLELRYVTEKTYALGFIMSPQNRGKGLMPKALKLVCEAAFTAGAKRIEWSAIVGNWSSWKAVWKIGFQREGTARGVLQKGQPTNMWTAALIPEDKFEPAAPWDGPGISAQPSEYDPQALVRQFHEVYGLPITQTPNVDHQRVHMRMSLILEECCELVGAVYGQTASKTLESAVAKAISQDDHTRDTIESADALADLVYVIYGMALECGINLPKVLREVQASNMSKLGADGRPIYREDGKVLKGPGFFEPQIARALGLK